MPIKNIIKNFDKIRGFENLPDCAYVRQPVVEVLFGCSSASIWRWVANGTLPRPTKISAGTTGWKVGDLRQKLEELNNE